VTDERAVGVDIGGTKIAAGLVGASGLVGRVEVIATESAAGGASVLGRAIALAQTVASESPAPVAVGVAAGGWIDPGAGRVIGATGLLPGWGGTRLRDEFEQAIQIPVSVLNDVQAIGLAEARLGAGRGRRHCLCVAVGTGIGGAIVINGRLFAGTHGFAGALGHVLFAAHGPPCSCGRRGCIEAFASGPAIARAFARCVGGSDDFGPIDSTGDTALSDVVRALGSADDAARRCATETVTTAGASLGRVLGGLWNVFDPDTIIVAGGAAAALGETFLGSIRSGVADVVLSHLDPEVVPAELGAGAGVVGAGLVALDAVRDAGPAQVADA
jgi:glucokinase